MDGDATVRITAIERDLARPGFDERFHRVSFEVSAGDMGPVTVPIWIHGAFPRTEVAGISRTFLAAALHDLAEAASMSAELENEHRFDDAEADALQAHRPARVRR